MELFGVVLLGLLQGLTEFLPISSSGHLVLFQALIGFKSNVLFFDTALHLGSLIAILYFFRPYLFKIKLRTIWLMAVASLPAIIAALLFHRIIQQFFSSPKMLPFTFLITALFLWSTKEKDPKQLSKKIDNLTLMDAFVIGIFQAVALLPGISRSGSTYTGGLWRYLKKESAFYFSFLMAIPAIIGAFALESNQIKSIPYSAEVILGIGASFVASLSGLFLFKKVIHYQKVHLLAYYCVIISILSYLIFY